MTNFDFTALITFLGALFDALKKFAEKLGIKFDFGNDDNAQDNENAAE